MTYGPQSGVAACRMMNIVTAEFANDIADTAVPAAAPCDLRPATCDLRTDPRSRSIKGRPEDKPEAK
ncbi:hypothetical protein ACWGPD_09470 [Streptomyces hirsutus]|uniref:hypothetical protein n=1 Tax=Streptomyces hirsutus TaxID=35620 RepID=UPI003634232E